MCVYEYILQHSSAVLGLSNTTTTARAGTPVLCRPVSLMLPMTPTSRGAVVQVVRGQQHKVHKLSATQLQGLLGQLEGHVRADSRVHLQSRTCKCP
jgi:hypothetical protein